MLLEPLTIPLSTVTLTFETFDFELNHIGLNRAHRKPK